MAATALGVTALAAAGIYTAYQAYNAYTSSIPISVPTTPSSVPTTPSSVPTTDDLSKGTGTNETTIGKGGNWSGSTRMTDCGRGRVTSSIDKISDTNGTMKTFTLCMAIGSYGDEYPRNTSVAKKRSLITKRRYQCLRNVETDLDRFKTLIEKDLDKDLFDVFEDKPGLKCQRSRDFYFMKIAEFLSVCDESGAMIYYTGHGVRYTGDWVFADACITFDDIFNLYLEHFRGRLLYIVTDACYSGNWTIRLAEKLEERRIGACGHLAKEQKIMIKVIAACRKFESAWDGVFAQEGMKLDNSHSLIFHLDKTIYSGGHKQTTCSLDSTRICCFEESEHTMSCKQQNIPSSVNWSWSDLTNKLKKKKIANRVKVRTHWDRNKRMHYWERVLVRDGTNEKDYIICSGWGNPPQNIEMTVTEYLY